MGNFPARQVAAPTGEHNDLGWGQDRPDKLEALFSNFEGWV